MFDALGVKNRKVEGDLLEIGTYKTSYNLMQTSGITVPYSMFGLNEDDYLQMLRRLMEILFCITKIRYIIL